MKKKNGDMNSFSMDMFTICLLQTTLIRITFSGKKYNRRPCKDKPEKAHIFVPVPDALSIIHVSKSILIKSIPKLIAHSHIVHCSSYRH